MPQELQIAPLRPSQIQNPTFTTNPKRSWKERFISYVRRLSSMLLIELYYFFRIFWLLWVCWSIIFFLFINWIFNLLIPAISKKYDL